MSDAPCDQCKHYAPNTRFLAARRLHSKYDAPFSDFCTFRIKPPIPEGFKTEIPHWCHQAKT